MIRLVLSFSAFLIFHLAACRPAGHGDANADSDPISKTAVQEEDVPQISPVARVVGPAEFQNLLEADKDAVLLDVRTPGEFQQGHLANAQLLDFNDPSFADKLSALDKTKRYHVYCAVGGRSHTAFERMQAMGFRHVVELDGGVNAWRAAGLPLTR